MDDNKLALAHLLKVDESKITGCESDDNIFYYYPDEKSLKTEEYAVFDLSEMEDYVAIFLYDKWLRKANKTLRDIYQEYPWYMRATNIDEDYIDELIWDNLQEAMEAESQEIFEFKGTDYYVFRLS